MNQDNPNGLKPDRKNPYCDLLEAQWALAKTVSRTRNFGHIIDQEYSMTISRQYLPLSFAKIFQNRDKLGDLTPNACKVVLHVALNLGYNEQRIRLTWQEVGLERRSMRKAILELIAARVLAPERQTWYWVNLSLILVGTIARQQGEKVAAGRGKKAS